MLSEISSLRIIKSTLISVWTAIDDMTYMLEKVDGPFFNFKQVGRGGLSTRTDSTALHKRSAAGSVLLLPAHVKMPPQILVMLVRRSSLRDSSGPAAHLG